MGRKNIIKSFAMFDAADISTNQESNITDVLYLDQASIHLTWTGTSPVGEIKVMAQNGEKDTYFELDFGSTISISGNTGEHVLILSEMPFTSLRLDFLSTSGTGSLTAYITSSTVGA